MILPIVQNVGTPKQRTLFPEIREKEQADTQKEAGWLAKHPITKAALKGAGLGLGASALGIASIIFTGRLRAINAGTCISAGIGATMGAMSAPKDSDGKKNQLAMLALGILGGGAGVGISLASEMLFTIGAIASENIIPQVITAATGGAAVGGVLVNTAFNSLNKTKT